MDTAFYFQLILLLIFISMSAMFSISETAFTSLSKISLRQMVENGVKGADRVNEISNNQSKMLSAVLIGNNVVNIAASSLATSIAIKAFGDSGVGIATGIMTFLILVFGEITPKTLASQNAESISLKFAGFVKFFMVILTPVIYLLTLVTGSLVKLLGGKSDQDRPFITEEELRIMVTASHQEGVIEDHEKEMIHKVFEFSEVKALDIMVPRIDIVAINSQATYDEAIEIINRRKFSRFPVYEGSIDKIIGMVYVKDLLFQDIPRDESFSIIDYMREVNFTYEYKSIEELFDEMRNNKRHIVIVLDEYGSTEGLITIEDVIEEIVGNIEDEYDHDKIVIEEVQANEFLVNGNLKLAEINDLFETQILSNQFDTLAGFMIGHINRHPRIGDEVIYGDIKFVIEEIRNNRIHKVRIFTN